MKRALLVVFLILPMLFHAQRNPRPATSGFRAVSIHAVGSKHFSDSEIVAATGLKAGQSTTPDQLKRIADTLASTGAFEEVNYKFGSTGAGMNVQFIVKDAPQFLHTSFDNFVWFTDRQLLDAVRARVPLFHGEVPAEGEMTNQVIEALQSLLASRGISGLVRFQLAEDFPDKPIESGVFSVEGIAIRVRNVTFHDANAAELPALETAGKKLLEMPYQRTATKDYMELSLLPVYLERGYLRARFGEPVVTLLSDSPTEPVISLAIPVAPGPQYQLGAIRWSGNKVIGTTELNLQLKVRLGEPANLVQMRRDLESVHALYAKKGYLRQSTREVTALDDSAKVANFELQLSEGEQYKLASISITGLEPNVHDLVREEWKLREGEPYNPGYISMFLNAALPLMKKGAVTKVEQDINDAKKTVEVSIHFDFQEPIKEPRPASPAQRPTGRKPGK